MKMFRNTIITFALTVIAITGFAQAPASSKIDLTTVLNLVEENKNAGLLSDSSFNSIKDKLFKDPELFNSTWQRVLDLTQKSRLDFLKDLNVQFKTFEATDSNKVSLGFSYDWDFSFTKKEMAPEKNSELDFKLSAFGNVAFNKELNPADFLSTRLVFSRQSYGGGFVNKPAKELKDSLTAIKMRLAAIDDDEEVKRSPLWGELMNHFKPRNHYYFDINVSAGLESNQDFTQKQWAYGAQAAFSVKSYSDDNPLSQLNIFDYPFALIRKLTGTDAELTPYGASFPVFMAGIDMITPDRDEVRKTLTGDLNSFPRFRFEAGFRTLMAELADLTIYFNADFRIYQEFGAPAEIKDAGLDQFVYFTSSLTSNKGFFVSYSNGKLPFDAQANGIYELGFNFKF